MTAPFVVPFNFQPSLTIQSTTNYTVPAGKYVRATGISPYCTFNSTKVFAETYSATFSSGTRNFSIRNTKNWDFIFNRTSGSGSASFGVIYDYKDGSGAYSEFVQTGIATSGSLSSFNFNPMVITSGNSATMAIQLSSISISIFTSSTIAATFNNYNEPGAFFWARTGDVLGGKWMIEEFNQII